MPAGSRAAAKTRAGAASSGKTPSGGRCASDKRCDKGHGSSSRAAAKQKKRVRNPEETQRRQRMAAMSLKHSMDEFAIAMRN